MALVLAACSSIERIADPTPVDRSAVSAVDEARFRSETFTAADGSMLPYRLLTPPTLEPGKRYPLVLQLHGSGAIGDDNRKQLDALAKAWALDDVRTRFPAFVVVPQFPQRSANYDDPQALTHAVAGAPLQAAMELVRQLAQQPTIDRERIYATGFSMGGSASWLAPLLAPDLFAAIMPVAGIAPPRTEAARYAHLPVLIAHGDADTENPVTSDRAMAQAIHDAGGRQVRLREYAGLTHRPAADLIPGHWWRQWLFAQRRQGTPPLPAALPWDAPVELPVITPVHEPLPGDRCQRAASKRTSLAENSGLKRASSVLQTRLCRCSIRKAGSSMDCPACALPCRCLHWSGAA